MNNDEMFDRVYSCVSEMVYKLPENYSDNLGTDYIKNEVYDLLTELYENAEDAEEEE